MYLEKYSDLILMEMFKESGSIPTHPYAIKKQKICQNFMKCFWMEIMKMRKNL